MLDNTTKRQIDSARDILVGKVPDPKAQIDQITTAMIYKFMDDMDKEAQELGGEARFFADILSDYSWTKLMDTKLSGEQRINMYREAIEKLKTAPNIPELFRNIFKNYYLPFYDARTLSLFLKEINEFSYDNSENLGNAFEYLLSILGSQGDAGQFRTPRHIIDFIVSVVDPKKNETTLDPACGTAGFLISAYKHIIKTNSSNYKPEKEAEDFTEQGETAIETIIAEKERYTGDKLTPDDKTKLTHNIAGYDIDSNMVKLALVNLYLHGFPDPKISEYDTLTSEKRWDETFDVILANPPFMTPKGGIVPHKRFSIQANRAEVLFVDYIAEHLSIKGRAGIIVPEGIIFQSANAYKNLRKNLIENWGLYAVVSLPSGVFQPYSGVKTSILLLDKEIAKKSDEVLFLKVENDGFDLGAQRRRIEKNDLPDCLRVLESWKKNVGAKNLLPDEDSKIAFAVKKEKIAENGDYNLTGDRYRETVDYGNAKWEMVELGEVFLEIKNGKNVNQIDEIGKYKVSRIQTIADGTVNLEKTKYTNDDVNENDFLQEGDILFSHINSFEHLAKTAIFQKYSEKVVHGANLIRLRPNFSKVIPKFALSIFKSDIFIENARKYAQKAVNQASINTSVIKSFSIPLPPLSVQEQIVAEIEQYQKVIDGAKQVVANWKPNFRIDPSWEMVELGEVCEIYNGSTPKRTEKDYWENGTIPWFTIEDIREQGRIIKKTKQTISESGFKNSSVKLLPKNSVLLCCTASIGEFAFSEIELTTNQQFNGLVVKEEFKHQLYPKYLFQVASKFKSELERLSGKTSFGFVSVGSLKQIKIPLPPLEVQEQIVAEIEAEQRAIDECKKLIEKMEKKIEAKIGEVWG
ncbi:MAG TPA: N-6 DNA methylase [Spirochaetia bacterium]|nr:MAG: hypothetical protein A2Y41_11170 [Spirochaetes bacterium GWB1_36_13]HCL56672.1 N-6 DNA methylase [Spirochaetia bacterium]